LRRDRQGVDGLEAQHRLSRQLDLLSLLGSRSSGPGARSSRRANGSAFATAKNSAEDRAGGSADTGPAELSRQAETAISMVKTGPQAGELRRSQAQFCWSVR
jgi:hypothetical protein